MVKHFLSVGLFSIMMVFATVSQAGTPILDSIKEKGFDAFVIQDDELGAIKGARLVSGMPMPSVTVGINRHYVSYKGFGNVKDFRSYRYLGSRHDRSNNHEHAENSAIVSQRIAGDEWLIDISSWNIVGSSRTTTAEYHYQHLNRQTGAPRATAFHSSYWNRPITTFRW